MRAAIVQQFPDYWYLVTTVALAYVALFVPPQVAFADVRVHSGRWWVAISIDAVRHFGNGQGPAGVTHPVYVPSIGQRRSGISGGHDNSLGFAIPRQMFFGHKSIQSLCQLCPILVCRGSAIHIPL